MQLIFLYSYIPVYLNTCILSINPDPHNPRTKKISKRTQLPRMLARKCFACKQITDRRRPVNEKQSNPKTRYSEYSLRFSETSFGKNNANEPNWRPAEMRQRHAKKKIVPERIRTSNLWLRRPTRYPLRYGDRTDPDQSRPSAGQYLYVTFACASNTKSNCRPPVKAFDNRHLWTIMVVFTGNPFMHVIINCIYCVAIILYSPKILYRMFAHNRYQGGWSQRLGYITRRRPDSPCIWIHAVSVGEVNALRTLVAQLKKRLPDHEIVLSSTTDTGKDRADALFGAEHSVFYFPFDLSWVMKRAMDRLRPDLILLMELEVWPNLASLAARRRIPVAVINGRLSDKSFPRYQKFRFLIRPMFAKVSLVLAQTAQYAERFIDLGCDPAKVIVTSSLKYDTAQTEGPVPGADRLAEQLIISDEPLWVAGGTGPGEEKIVLDVFARLRRQPGLENLRLAVVPRKPERFNEVADLIEQAGFAYVRYSSLKANDRPAAEKSPVILGDTMGDLKKFYAVAAVVFVGRSLVPMGGSDMMEPAGLGKCTLFGPHTFNFRQTVEVLLADKGALEVADANELYEVMLRCLTDSAYAQRLARSAQDIIRRNQGATLKTVDAVAALLNRSS